MLATAPTRRAPTADPYRDLDVIDANAPRFNQATVGTVSLLAVATGWWPLLTVLAVQLAVGLRLGRRYCLPCVVYFELVQPRLGEGPIEDARPPRFANQVGLAVLAGASVAHLVGLPAIGAGLGILVAGLALLAAATGFCTGCWLYRIGARMGGVSRSGFDRVEPGDVGRHELEDGLVIAFSHPLCTECRSLAAELEARREPYVSIDVRERSDLARKYGIGVVPTAVRVDAAGRVLGRVA